MSKAPIYPKRLIEVDLPIKKISAHARREKSIRHGHISTLHIWWARRPLAACRAVILASLWPDPADPNCPERFRREAARWMKALRDRRGGTPRDWDNPFELRAALLDFIADFANWDLSNEMDYLETSRALVQVAHESLGGLAGTMPLIFDPFAGGGAFPLEALRVGGDAFASDLNPLAVLLNKVVIEYLPRYGQRLADDVRKWGTWIRTEAEKKLGALYPSNSGAPPIAYLWARTVRCEGPRCGIEIPLVRSLWLVRKGSSGTALRLALGDQRKSIVVEILKNADAKSVGHGTSKGGAATCPACGYTTTVERVRAQLSERAGGSVDAFLLAVVDQPVAQGRVYRAPRPADLDASEAAKTRLRELRRSKEEPHPIPDEPLNHLRGFFNVVLYGMTRWGDLFAPRQLVSLSTFWTILRDRLPQNLPSADSNYLLALQTTLACVLGRATNGWSSLCRWNNIGENIEGTFARQALPMVWDYAETNPFSSSTGNFSGALEWVVDVCDAVAAAGLRPGQVVQATATKHPLPDDSAELLATDPPYYDAVPYADLSDYFYVWFRRGLGANHPDLFTAKLSPKDEECVTLAHRAAMYRNKDRAFFESQMSLAVSEARRVVKPNGCAVVVFANKSTEGWEAMLSALVNSGWIITASWPIDTERGSRLRAQASAALASSVHLVCRPRESSTGAEETELVGDWRDVLAELPSRIHEWMPRLALEGVVGADAIFSCLGPALEVFSRYSRVEKTSGDGVSLKEYLEHIWAAVAKEALVMIFSGADATGFEEDARLTAMWLWTLSSGGSNGNGATEAEDAEPAEDEIAGKSKVGGFELEYDAARKIAQGLGAHLEALSTLIEVKGSTARLLPVAERTRSLFQKGEPTSPTSGRKPKKKAGQLAMGFMADLEAAEETGGWGDTGAPQKRETVLDRVHQSMILFGAGRGEALKRFLVDDGVGRDDRFWRLAQAFSALYPASTDEKRWVDGVLARKKGLGL